MPYCNYVIRITNFGCKDGRHQTIIRLCECCGKKFDDFDEVGISLNAVILFVRN